MDTPIRFVTNFKSSDGVDLGNKFITKDYLLSVYPHLVPHLTTSSLFWQGAEKRTSSPITYDKLSLHEITSNTNNKNYSIDWKQISNSKFGNTTTFHSAAIKNDGSLWTWGDNNRRQLGYPSNTNDADFYYVNPSKVGTDLDWKQVSCGHQYTMAIKNDGSLWGWGAGSYYVLGRGNTESQVNTPTQIGTSYDWKQVFCDYTTTYAIKNDGSLWSWGTNYSYMLGQGYSSQFSVSYTPTRIGADFDWKTLDCGYYAAYAIKNNGTLWGWGYTSFSSGTLGSGDNPLYSPTMLSSLTDWKFVSVGVQHVAAIRSNGRLYSRGNNGNGALGDNTTNSSSSFREVFNNGLWKYVSCGYDFTVGIMVDGSLWAWGNNRDKQISQDSFTGIVIPRRQSTSYNWKQVSAHPFAYGAIRSYD